MLLDILIVAVCISALIRGFQIGFVRQLCSTSGFFGGLLLGAWLEPHVIHFVHSTDARAVLLVVTILGSGLAGLSLGEYVGMHIKHRVIPKRLHTYDDSAGSLISVVSLLAGVWLLASVMNSSTFSGMQSLIRSSRIVTQLNKLLPPAPGVIAKLSHLIDPNGFPDVFIGNEPTPKAVVNLPALGELAAAVTADKDSVVRIKGEGCGGVVSGSGFVVGPGLVATNAHVVAGIRHPFAQDIKGTHVARVVWFNPDLDFAVLRVNNLAGHSLSLAAQAVSPATASAVLDILAAETSAQNQPQSLI